MLGALLANPPISTVYPSQYSLLALGILNMSSHLYWMFLPQTLDKLPWPCWASSYKRWELVCASVTFIGPKGNLGILSQPFVENWREGTFACSLPILLLCYYQLIAWVVSCYTWCFSKRPWKQPSLPKERQKKTITTVLGSQKLVLNSYTSLFQSFSQRSQDTGVWSFPLLFCFTLLLPIPIRGTFYMLFLPPLSYEPLCSGIFCLFFPLDY